MSRVEEALRRAAAAPRLAAASHQIAERPADRWDRSVLESYPHEEGLSLDAPASPVSSVSRASAVSPVSKIEPRVPPAVAPLHLPESAISVPVNKAYRGKLVANGNAPEVSIEQ